MELVKLATGEPITREQIEAEWITAQPATVMAWGTVEGEDGPEPALVEIPNQVESPLPADLTGVDLSAFGAAIVEPVDPPVTEPGEVAEPDGVENVGGVWRQKWAVRPRTAQELASEKVARWEQVKSRRDVAIDAGCEVPSVGRFDTDLLSRTNINGAVTAATIAAGQVQPFSVPWKLQDNTVTTLNAQTMIAAGMAIMQHTSACHAHAQTLGLAIDGATSFAALEAIDIEAGWPS